MAGRCRRSRAARRRRPTSTRSCPTGRCSCPTATTTAPGSTRRALELAGIDREHARPAGRPDRARRRRHARAAPCTRARCALVVAATCRAPRGEDYYAAPDRGAALPPLARRHGLAGRHRRRVRRHGRPRRDVRRRRPRTATSLARRRRALVGATARASSRSPTSSAAARRSAAAASRRRAIKIMQDGVAENGTAAMLTPYLDADGHETDNRGPLVRRGRRAARGGRRRSTPRASRCTCTRSATGPRARRSTRSRARLAATAAHHIAHIQVVHPDDVPRFAELGVAANAQALWACEDEQMTELTLPFLGPERARVAVPVRRPAPRRRPAGDGQRLAGQHPRPAPGDARRGHPHGVRRAGRAVPARAGRSTSRPPSRRTPPARRWINRRDELDGAGVLAPGAAADLVVAGPRPVRRPAPRRSARPRVVSTWIDGETVYALTGLEARR